MKLYYNKFKGGSDYKQLDFRAAPVSNFRTNQFSKKKNETHWQWQENLPQAKKKQSIIQYHSLILVGSW